MSLRNAYWITTAACASVIVLLSSFAPEEKAGPCDSPLVGGHTGAPGESSCTGCHGGSANSGSAEVEWNIGGAGGTYVPGTQYTASVKIKRPGRDKFGFVCLALQDAGNVNLGGFGLLETVRTRIDADGPRDDVSATPCGADAADSIDWTFTWQAPATDVGTITIYMADLVANHNHSLTGDETYTRTITLSPSAVGFEPYPYDVDEISVFPNPAGSTVMLGIPVEGSRWLRFELYDSAQRLLRRWSVAPSTAFVNEPIDLTGIPSQLLHVAVVRNGDRLMVPIIHE